MAVRRNGQLVVAGTYKETPTGTNRGVGIAQFTDKGLLDGAFGAPTPYGVLGYTSVVCCGGPPLGRSRPRAFQLLPEDDGRVMVAFGRDYSPERVPVIRWDRFGTGLDPYWGNAGRAAILGYAGIDTTGSFVVRGDKTIVAEATTEPGSIRRYLANVELDTSFAGGAITPPDGWEPLAPAVQSDGRILVLCVRPSEGGLGVVRIWD
jgi:hypothetical protein